MTLDVSAGKLTAGSQFCVKLIYTKDNDVQEVFSEYFTVAASGEKTREEIIANTSAVLLQDGETLIMPKDIPHAVFGQERFKMQLIVSF